MCTYLKVPARANWLFGSLYFAAAMFVSADVSADPRSTRSEERVTVRATTASAMRQVPSRGPTQSFFTINEILENGTTWPAPLS